VVQVGLVGHRWRWRADGRGVAVAGGCQVGLVVLVGLGERAIDVLGA